MEVKTIVPIQTTPKAILAFTGWPDAGELSKHTFAELIHLLPYEPVGNWDLDGYWSTESIRPQIEVRHGQMREIEWPMFRFFRAPTAEEEGVLLGLGAEPSSRWRAFSTHLFTYLKEWGCEELLLLGSLYDQVLHDEVVISAVVGDVETFNLARAWECAKIEYEGPGAIHSAILQVAPEYDVRIIGLWAHLPFYLKNVHELVLPRLLQLISFFVDRKWDLDHLSESRKERLGQIEALLQQEPELHEQIKALKQEPKRFFREGKTAEKIIRMDEFLQRKEDQDKDK